MHEDEVQGVCRFSICVYDATCLQEDPGTEPLYSHSFSPTNIDNDSSAPNSASTVDMNSMFSGKTPVSYIVEVNRLRVSLINTELL